MVLLLWGGAMGVDIGFTVTSSRQAQALADTAALDLARYINLADFVKGSTPYNSYINLKLANAQADNHAGNVTFTVTGEYWSTKAPVGWTKPSAASGTHCYSQLPNNNPPCTAVVVTATVKVPRIFVGGATSVTRSSMAAVTPEDGFSIGTYLASFNTQQTPVLNAVFGPLDTGVNLSAASYQGLANGSVTVQQLIAASGGALTPSNVLTTSLPAASWLNFLTIATGTQQAALNCSSTPVPNACSANAALKLLSFSGSTAKLCQLVSINGSGCAANNDTLTQPGLSASLNVLQTLLTVAEVANNGSAVNVGAALGITGVSAATLSLQVVQPPQVAYGPVGGATATSAQVNADLQLSGPLLPGVLDIAVTGAQGTGILNQVSCSEQDNTLQVAGVTASTTTATAAVKLGGTSIGSLTMSGVSPAVNMPFGPSAVPPSPATAGANPLSIGTTSPSLSYSGTATGFASTLLTSTLQPVLGPVLEAAGVTVGGAAVADLGYNCGAVSLIK